METTKSPLKSVTVWSGVGGLLSSGVVVLNAAQYYLGLTDTAVDPETLRLALVTLATSLGALWGRWRAQQGLSWRPTL